MADKLQKQIDKVARVVAHGDERLSRVERAVFWVKVLELTSPDRVLTILATSEDATDIDNCRRAREKGRDAARVSALVDLLVESHRTPNPQRSSGRAASLIFHWHDWLSFEMDLRDWVKNAPATALAHELERRVDGPERAVIDAVRVEFGL
jgi:hypothetical protein